MAPIPEETPASEATTDANDAAVVQATLLANSVVLPMALQAAIELGLLEIIAGAGRDTRITAAEVAAQLPAKENPQAAQMVDRILRLLATFPVVSCSDDYDEGGEGTMRRVYGLTAVGRYLVKDDDGLSLSPLLRLVTVLGELTV